MAAGKLSASESRILSLVSRMPSLILLNCARRGIGLGLGGNKIGPGRMNQGYYFAARSEVSALSLGAAAGFGLSVDLALPCLLLL
jgi:hypothetical protein